MKSNRRAFLEATLLGAGALSAGMAGMAKAADTSGEAGALQKKPPQQRIDNMCGYAAPKLDRVRVGFIGIGHRGGAAVERFTYLEGIEITALCDLYDDRVQRGQQVISRKESPRPKGFSDGKNAWKSVCESPEVDLVYICTPWALHAPMALYAMECGKHVAVEVPAAKTLDECWQLVETSERTRKHCMMLENCCYDFFELLTLNMARRGFFGDIIHGEGTYIHFNRPLYVDKTYYAEMWRLREETRNGNLYPTHGLGPICQIMNVNRGDRMDYMISVQSADFVMADLVNQLATKDSFYKDFAGRTYRGNMNTSVIRTLKGRTIMVQHDVTSPRPYSRSHLVSGTKAVAQKWPLPARIALATGHHHWLGEAEMKGLEEQYTPAIVRRIGETAKRVGGHGGMDFMMDWRLIDCLHKALPLDQDVYDAALWSSITPLSEKSVASRSASVDIPDFTRGAWRTNAPVELG